ncbi:MAG: cobalamin-dependent protein [Candidatus Cloacimonetes bacterium]|nr:cobalamin-dependent protein [Candidatus Cloacimonadota bacterium]
MDKEQRKNLSQTILNKKDLVSDLTLQGHFERKPMFTHRYNPRQLELCRKDILYNLSFLAQAIELDSPKLFEAYVRWLRTFLNHIGVLIPDVKDNFISMEQALLGQVSENEAPEIKSYISLALNVLEIYDSEDPSYISKANPLRIEANTFLNHILAGERHKASEMILNLVRQQESIKSIYLNILQPVQHEIGRLWQTNQISVAQEHYSTAITQLVISQLYPYIFTNVFKGKSLLASCVSGELHEIGLRMLSDIFELEGWDTWYLGANMPHGDIVKTIQKKKPDIIALSTTMTYHLSLMEDLIALIRSSGIQTPIMVGGYPFNLDPELWQKVGANATASDADTALRVAFKLVEAV